MNLLNARSLPLAINTTGMMFFFTDDQFLSFTDGARTIASPTATASRWSSVQRGDGRSANLPDVRAWTRQA